MRKVLQLIAQLTLGVVLGGLVPPFYSSYVIASEMTTALPGEVQYNPQAVFSFMRSVSEVFRRYDQRLYLLGPEHMECGDYCDNYGIYTLGVSLQPLSPQIIDTIVGELIMVSSAYGFSVHLQEHNIFFHYSPEL